MAVRECGLKNDALMDVFYDKVMESWNLESDQDGCGQKKEEYAVFVFHDRYDIPAKAADQERLGESEEMFEYLIGVLYVLSSEIMSRENRNGDFCFQCLPTEAVI